MNTNWIVYRTRFLVRARRLTQPLTFVDSLGREHSGKKGDYLVESSDGSLRIAPRAIFEDVYVAMGTSRGTQVAFDLGSPPAHPLNCSPAPISVASDLGLGAAQS